MNSIKIETIPLGRPAGREGDRMSEQNHAAVLAAYRILADYAQRNPFAGLDATEPKMPARTGAVVRRAARTLRSPK